MIYIHIYVIRLMVIKRIFPISDLNPAMPVNHLNLLGSKPRRSRALNVNIPLSDDDRKILDVISQREHTSYGRLFRALLLRAHEGSIDVADALASLPPKGTPGRKAQAPTFDNNLTKIYLADPDFKIKSRFARMGRTSITQDELEKARVEDAAEDAARLAKAQAPKPSGKVRK